MSLTDRLRSRILQHGPIPFREFMEEALYSPDGGYYTSGRGEIGRKGDFYTSVSVGAVFGRLLARQFIEMWERLGSPKDFTIVEQGAHTGQFAEDVLRALERFAPALAESLTYRIIEPSPALREQQHERLTLFGERVSWCESVAELPEFTGVHFSNELIDAFPVARCQWDGTGWHEQSVNWADDRFALVADREPAPPLRPLLAKAPLDLPPGYITEVNPSAASWITDLSAKLAKGWILAIDYGYPRSQYFRPDRTNGTLAAYAGHQRVDNYLQNPGHVDLTAHVDFTSLAEAAEACGLELCGFTDQHHLMVGLSRLHFTDRSDALSAEDQKELLGFRTLMHPEMMGLSFKAICFGRGVYDVHLSAFSMAREPRTALELAPKGQAG